MSTKRRTGAAIGATGVAVLLVRLLVKVNDAARYPDALKVLAVVLLMLAVVVPAWLAWLFHRARTFRRQLRLAHPERSSSTPSGQGANLGDSSKRPTNVEGKGHGIHPGPGRGRPRASAGQTTTRTRPFRTRAVGKGCVSENGNPTEAAGAPPHAGH